MITKTFGYFNKIAFINLFSKEIQIKSIDETLYENFIGGSGLAAALYYKITEGELIEPLDPDSPLLFMAGPLAGTPVPTANRFHVSGRSPLTKIWGEADAGGAWAYYLKRAGLDGIVIQGRSESPVYLWVQDTEIKILPAEHLWGKDTYEIDNIIKSETHPEAAIASIGQAGENQVNIAAIMSMGCHARPAARCGLGAVMGSKNLKAIAVYGAQETPIADITRLKESIKQVVPGLVSLTEGLKKFGTSGIFQSSLNSGDTPIKNWRLGTWDDGVKKVNGIILNHDYTTKRYHCKGCVIGCGREVEIESGPYAISESAGPEYETMAGFGSLCLVDNLEVIIKANELCNRYGIDTISTSAVIAFAMEAFEKGIITLQDTGGIDLSWGNEEAVIELTHQIGTKRGIGELLGLGVQEAAKQLGNGADDFAIHVKGLELPFHDPRAYNSLAAGYATSNRGGCHLQAMAHTIERGIKISGLGFDNNYDRFATDGKGYLTATMQDLMCLFDSLKLCKFVVFGSLEANVYVEWLNATTGWELSLEEFLKIGERIFILKRLLNLKFGVCRETDIIPKRILNEPRGTGGAPDQMASFSILLEDYYRVRGWASDGTVSKEKIAELGLEEFITK